MEQPIVRETLTEAHVQRTQPRQSGDGGERGVAQPLAQPQVHVLKCREGVSERGYGGVRHPGQPAQLQLPQGSQRSQRRHAYVRHLP